MLFIGTVGFYKLNVKELFAMKKTRIIALAAALTLTMGTTGLITGCGKKEDTPASKSAIISIFQRKMC